MAVGDWLLAVGDWLLAVSRSALPLPIAPKYVHLHLDVKESFFSLHLYTIMKLLITGGAGFIGSNLCEYFLREGHTVRCLDNFATGKPANILPLLATYPDRFELIVGDIRNLDDCRKAVG